MKSSTWLCILFMASGVGLLRAQPKEPSESVLRRDEIAPAKQFIFFAVLEGLYEDGVSTEDVEQILLRNKGQSYYHFIYACPICTTTIWALEAYRDRPKQFYGMKRPGSTFGSGLSEELHKKLYSSDSNERLGAINQLTKKWLSRRMARTEFSKDEKAELVTQLAELRQQGANILKSFRNKEHGDSGVEQLAPAYVDVDECAVCNGAVGKVMQMPEN